MNPIETNPLVIVLAGALTQGLTWAASRWMPQESRVRAAIPALATCIALGLVTAWQAIQGADAMSWQTVWNGLLAGAAAVLMHSQGSQMLKAAKKAKALDTTAKLGLVLLVALLLPGCGGQTSYLPILQSSLTASQALTRGAQTQAVESGSLTACLASGALSDAFSSASDALDAWAQAEPDTYTLPGFKVDVSPCGNLSEGFEPLLREEAAAKVRSYTEGLAPLALTVTRAAVASTGMDCRDQLLVLAVLGYLEGALRPVVDELTSPDGVLEIPAVELNLARCG